MQTSIPVVPQRLKTLRGLGAQTYLGRVAQRARLEQFDLVRQMGGGGMAEVLLARPFEGRQELVVLKLLRRHLVGGEMYRKMFLDEIQVTTRLHHPNLVRIAEPGYSLVDWFLVLQPVSGLSLSRFLRRLTELAVQGHPLSLKAIAFIAAQVASGLAYVNSIRDDYGNPMRVVHRDVSPKNIMITGAGQVKLIDFGLTHLEGRAAFTRAGEVKGKLGYISPEQLSRAQPITHQSDIFSLGIVLWEMLTGRRLFLRRTYAESLAALSEGRVDAPSSVRRLPPLLDDIVMQALRPDPQDRFGDAGQMSAALMDYVGVDRENVQTELVRKVGLVRASHPRDFPLEGVEPESPGAARGESPADLPTRGDADALITTRVHALFRSPVSPRTPVPAASADAPASGRVALPRFGAARLAFHLANRRLRRQLRHARTKVRARPVLALSAAVALVLVGSVVFLRALSPATPAPTAAPAPTTTLQRPAAEHAPHPRHPPLVIEAVSPDPTTAAEGELSPPAAPAHSPRRRHHRRKQ